MKNRIKIHIILNIIILCMIGFMAFIQPSIHANKFKIGFFLNDLISIPSVLLLIFAITNLLIVFKSNKLTKSIAILANIGILILITIGIEDIYRSFKELINRYIVLSPPYDQMSTLFHWYGALISIILLAILVWNTIFSIRHWNSTKK